PVSLLRKTAPGVVNKSLGNRLRLRLGVNEGRILQASALPSTAIVDFFVGRRFVGRK
ncbi:MAG: hypothetical protein ACJAWL_003712, partial [Motiliproteus sp.]